MTTTPTATLSQRVLKAIAMRPLLQAEGRRRQAHGGTAPGRRKQFIGADHAGRHSTRDLLGALVGVSGKTLVKAIEVIEAAKKNPDRYVGVVRKMDETGNVEAAYSAVLFASTVRILTSPKIFLTTKIGGVSLGEFTARELRWHIEFFAALDACMSPSEPEVYARKLFTVAEIERAVRRADQRAGGKLPPKAFPKTVTGKTEAGVNRQLVRSAPVEKRVGKDGKARKPPKRRSTFAAVEQEPLKTNRSRSSPRQSLACRYEDHGN
jgi:hypothetical protein